MPRGNPQNLKPPFKKGQKPPAKAGRPKGVPNRTTTLLKEAVLLAAYLEGRDGKGKDGLTGYLRMIAKKYPQSYVQLLNRVLPLQVNASFSATVKTITVTMTAKEAAEIYAETLRGAPMADEEDDPEALPPVKMVASK